MKIFFNPRLFQVILSLCLALGIVARVHAADQTFRIVKPLIIEPGSDATFKNLKPGRPVLTRQISEARTVRLTEGVVFSQEHGSYSVKAGTLLAGVLDLGVWQEGDVPPAVLFSPDEETGKEALMLTAELRVELLRKMTRSMHLAEIDLSAYAEADWLYCGEGTFVDKEGNGQNTDLCLGDMNGDGFFDRAAMIVFQGMGGLIMHEATVIEGAQVQAGYELSATRGTNYEWAAMPYREKKNIGLDFGYIVQGNAEKMGRFHRMHQESDDGLLNYELFEDLFKVEQAKKKKRVNVVVKASDQSVAVIMPYDVKLPSNQD